MKSMLKLPLVAVAIVLAAPFSFAQEKDAPPPPPPGEQGPGPKEGRGMRGDRFKMFVEKLGLTEEQQAKIKPIVAEEAKALKALWDDQSLDRAVRREKAAEIFKKTIEQIKPLLTPEQLKKLETMKEDFMRARGPGGPGGPRKEKKE